MERFQICFYLDDENMTLEYKGIFVALNKNEAIKTATRILKPKNSKFHTSIKWNSPRS